MKLKSLFFTTVFTMLLTFPIFANALTPEQEQQAHEQMQLLQNNISSGKVMGVFERNPPSYLRFLAMDMGVTTEQLSQRIQYLSQIIPKKGDKNFTFDWQKAIVGTTLQRDYIIVPCQASMVIDNKVQTVSSYVLLLTEKQQWYAIPNINIPDVTKKLKYAYPDLANIEFPQTISK